MHEWIGLPNSTPCMSGLDDRIAAFAFAALPLCALRLPQRKEGRRRRKGKRDGEKEGREEENQP